MICFLLSAKEVIGASHNQYKADRNIYPRFYNTEYVLASYWYCIIFSLLQRGLPATSFLPKTCTLSMWPNLLCSWSYVMGTEFRLFLPAFCWSQRYRSFSNQTIRLYPFWCYFVVAAMVRIAEGQTQFITKSKFKQIKRLAPVAKDQTSARMQPQKRLPQRRTKWTMVFRERSHLRRST